MSRTFIIGDIHGRAKALEDCLVKSKFDLEKDVLIQLGDVCDHGGESRQAVEVLMKVKNLISIRGNHDARVELWLKTGFKDPDWLNNGGTETLISYEPISSEEKEKHKIFYQNQVNYHISDTNDLFVHAGFLHPQGPGKEADPSVLYWDRSMWFDALKAYDEGHSPPERLSLYNEIFIGHTPTLNYGIGQPMHVFNIWNLDTGAGTYGRLSIMELRTKEVIQSGAH